MPDQREIMPQALLTSATSIAAHGDLWDHDLRLESHVACAAPQVLDASIVYVEAL